MATARLIWPPHPYRAGFCITDDTDAATLESVRLVYDFLSSVGLRTTKTVWVFEPSEPCGIPALPPSILRGITLQDPQYLDTCRALSERGFEICLHGASAGNNVRERTARALEFVERHFGAAGTYVCHAKNAENPYWHEKVVPRGPLQWLLARASRYRCSGEDPASPYFWGDLCLEKVRHIRLFRTRSVNTLAENPSMPYFDPEKPWVPSWFSATKRSFHDCTTATALEELKREHGLCVLYQYMHRYADLREGRVQPAFEADAQRLMSTPGLWVDTTSAVLDRLRQIQGVFLAHRDREAWLLNAGDRDVTDLQMRVDSRAVVECDVSGVEANGDTIHVPRLEAGRMLGLRAQEPPRFGGNQAIPLDPRGRGRARARSGTVLVNAGREPWRVSEGVTVEPGGFRLEPDPATPGPGPRSSALARELHRLLIGQMAILVREVLFKGRSLDTRRFLGSEEIALEDHANW